MKKLIDITELSAAERAVAVSVYFQNSSYRDTWPLNDVHAELCDLITSSGATVAAEVKVKREKPTPNYLIGKGKAEEIRDLCVEKGAQVIIMSEDLSFVQQRNLEALMGLKVIDRTQLILDIFAQRAHSQEGKIQVELAQLEYLLPRLVGEGIMLSRLGGGIGTRGPGEQKLEVDRRKLRRRIFKLKQDLGELYRHRHSLAVRRQRQEIPMVALVGYTNAGKSTLLNALTDAGVVSEDRLFSTLDSVSKALVLPDNQKIIITDTVGFLHRLPHHLIEAFKATLESVLMSDVLVAVIDARHENAEKHFDAVFEVLKELNAENKKTVICFNKIDLLDGEYMIRRLGNMHHNSVFISALTHKGLDTLVRAIQRSLEYGFTELNLTIAPGEQGIVSALYRDAQVLAREYDSLGNTLICAKVPERLLHKFKKFVEK